MGLLVKSSNFGRLCMYVCFVNLDFRFELCWVFLGEKEEKNSLFHFFRQCLVL